ncbi:hypothetical protein NECID01_1535 [Nematocida sp. AWRm77]|nr:hypothetical protein NECID01_1535 [Nematocida sp. AWRm77]
MQELLTGEHCPEDYSEFFKETHAEVENSLQYVLPNLPDIIDMLVDDLLERIQTLERPTGMEKERIGVQIYKIAYLMHLEKHPITSIPSESDLEDLRFQITLWAMVYCTEPGDIPITDIGKMILPNFCHCVIWNCLGIKDETKRRSRVTEMLQKISDVTFTRVDTQPINRQFKFCRKLSAMVSTDADMIKLEKQKFFTHLEAQHQIYKIKKWLSSKENEAVANLEKAKAVQTCIEKLEYIDLSIQTAWIVYTDIMVETAKADRRPKFLDYRLEMQKYILRKLHYEYYELAEELEKHIDALNYEAPESCEWVRFKSPIQNTSTFKNTHRAACLFQTLFSILVSLLVATIPSLIVLFYRLCELESTVSNIVYAFGFKSFEVYMSGVVSERTAYFLCIVLPTWVLGIVLVKFVSTIYSKLVLEFLGFDQYQKITPSLYNSLFFLFSLDIVYSILLPTILAHLTGTSLRYLVEDPSRMLLLLGCLFSFNFIFYLFKISAVSRSCKPNPLFPEKNLLTSGVLSISTLVLKITGGLLIVYWYLSPSGTVDGIWNHIFRNIAKGIEPLEENAASLVTTWI